MVVLRGRGAQPVRPGTTVKGVLLGEIPLPTGELVSEAAITDLHNSYKELIKRENALRPKDKWLRGMTAQSFKTLFKFAQLLGLVELVREEPMLFPPPGGPLYSLRKPDGVHAVVSTRRVFRLTGVGREDERSWTNLCRAWMEKWPAPAKIEYAPPYVPPPPKPRPPKVVPVFVPFKWVAKPSMRQFRLLARHLEELQSIGIDAPDVSAEVDHLAMRVGDWLLDIEDSLDEARAIHYTEAIHKYEVWHKCITGVMEGLMDMDLPRAIATFREITG